MKPFFAVVRLILCPPSVGAMVVACLSACASHTPESFDALAPAQWQASLPHQGHQAELENWWQQFHDPLLIELQHAAQEVSPTLAQAKTRIAQARAAKADATRALLPDLNAQASASRAKSVITQAPPPAPPMPAINYSDSALLRSTWELDIFGGNRAARRAAQARVQGADALWHEARVLVAAEVATQYVNLRACEAQRAQTEIDARSRDEIARLTELTVKTGLQAPATAALAQAGAAQAHAQADALQAQCDIVVKGLVAFTGLGEPALRERLAEHSAQIPEPAQLNVAKVPAQVLNQRPDLLASAREVVAAYMEVAQAKAARFPHVSLGGFIGSSRSKNALGRSSGSIWSVGPVTISLPILDGGVQAAQVGAAKAQYEQAVINYRAQVRTAVREVEEALVQLASLHTRQLDSERAVQGFETNFKATEARSKVGLASVIELEESRRLVAQAKVAEIDLQRQQVITWVALYRAMGGGWQSYRLPVKNAFNPVSSKAQP